MRVSCAETAVIIADPPWPHANGSRTNSGKSPKYPLMNLREIGELGRTVSDLSGRDAVLYLWATGPHLPGAISTVEAWGFTYRSFHVWRKRRIAAGFWARSDAELCLIAERGQPYAPKGSDLPRTVFEEARTTARHSSKPDTVHIIAERLWPSARKIELFARCARAGWESYGSDIGHKIASHGIDLLQSETV